MVTLSVGFDDSPTVWHLHKKLLTSSSPFFAAALDGNFAEAKTGAIKLREDDPGAVMTFVEWLYGSLDRSLKPNDIDTFVMAWQFGDKIGCPDFQNSAMSCLIDALSCSEYTIQASTLRLAFRNPGADSKLSQLVVECFRWQHDKNLLTERIDELISVVEEVPEIAQYLCKSFFTTEYVPRPVTHREVYWVDIGDSPTGGED